MPELPAPAPEFLAFLREADLETLVEKRNWLDEYAGRVTSGHSEIARNLRLYDEAIAARELSATDAEDYDPNRWNLH